MGSTDIKPSPESGDDYRQQNRQSRKAAPGTALPGRESINFVHFSALLSACNTCMAFLTQNRMQDEDQPNKGALDGGVKASVEGTLINICNRIDTMVCDNSRWSLAEQETLETTLRALYDDQRDFIQQQKQAVVLMRAPHGRFHPTLTKLDDGRWAAFFGNPSIQADLIVGVGNSPEEALMDFDKVFTGKKYEQQHKQMDGSGRTVPTGEPINNDPPADRREVKPPHRGRAGKKPTTIRRADENGFGRKPKRRRRGPGKRIAG